MNELLKVQTRESVEGGRCRERGNLEREMASWRLMKVVDSISTCQ